MVSLNRAIDSSIGNECHKKFSSLFTKMSTLIKFLQPFHCVLKTLITWIVQLSPHNPRDYHFMLICTRLYKGGHALTI